VPTFYFLIDNCVDIVYTIVMKLPNDIRIIASALKHGITKEQIYDCIYNPYKRPFLTKSNYDPDVIFVLGETQEYQLLEIAYAMEKDDIGRVFHAMPMRENYKKLYKQRRKK